MTTTDRPRRLGRPAPPTKTGRGRGLMRNLWEITVLVVLPLLTGYYALTRIAPAIGDADGVIGWVGVGVGGAVGIVLYLIGRRLVTGKRKGGRR